MFILERLPPLRKVTLDLSTKSAKILDHLRPWIDLASESGIMPVHGHDMWLENCLKARGLSNNRLDMYSGIRTVVKLMVEVCYSSGGEEEAGAELDQAAQMLGPSRPCQIFSGQLPTNRLTERIAIQSSSYEEMSKVIVSSMRTAIKVLQQQQ